MTACESTFWCYLGQTSQLSVSLESALVSFKMLSKKYLDCKALEKDFTKLGASRRLGLEMKASIGSRIFEEGEVSDYRLGDSDSMEWGEILILWYAGNRRVPRGRRRDKSQLSTEDRH